MNTAVRTVTVIWASFLPFSLGGVVIVYRIGGQYYAF